MVLSLVSDIGEELALSSFDPTSGKWVFAAYRSGRAVAVFSLSRATDLEGYVVQKLYTFPVPRLLDRGQTFAMAVVNG